MKKSTPAKSEKKVSKAPSLKPPAEARELYAEIGTCLYMIASAVPEVESALAEVERGSKDWLDQLQTAYSTLDDIRECAEGVANDIQNILRRV